MDRKQHWDSIYRAKDAREVTWYQPDAAISMELIKQASSQLGSVIDIGGGASVLVDNLLAAGFQDLAVLDISAAALERAKQRLASNASRVRWIAADVTTIDEVGKFDVWHDRAVFHFLTDANDRLRYVALATRTLPVGGHLVVGTFALDGPPKCSGLDVCRYDGEQLQRELGAAFEIAAAIAVRARHARG